MKVDAELLAKRWAAMLACGRRHVASDLAGDDFVSVTVAAEALGVSASTIRRRIARRELLADRADAAGPWRVLVAGLGPSLPGDVAKALMATSLGAKPYDLLLYLRRPEPALDGLAPIVVLMSPRFQNTEIRRRVAGLRKSLGLRTSDSLLPRVLQLVEAEAQE